MDWLDMLDVWYNRQTEKKNVLVYPKPLFPYVVEKLKGKSDIAYISIEATPECAKYYLEPEHDDYDNEHYLEDGPNVFNVNFDDLGEDREYKGHIFRTITQEQADDMVDFIEKNLGKHFIVHCKAGASRSQAVHRFILDMYSDQYEKCPENLENPCETPNMEVVRKLKIAWRNRHGGSAFGKITT